MKAFKNCARVIKFSPSAANGKKEKGKGVTPSQPQPLGTPVIGSVSQTIVEGAMHHEFTLVDIVGTNYHISSPPPLNFSAGSNSPKKAHKIKSFSRNKTTEKKILAQVKACCLSSEINENNGLKRKQADEMLIDNAVDTNVKKNRNKGVGLVDGGIVHSVEAEVGESQPHPAL